MPRCSHIICISFRNRIFCPRSKDDEFLSDRATRSDGRVVCGTSYRFCADGMGAGSGALWARGSRSHSGGRYTIGNYAYQPCALGAVTVKKDPVHAAASLTTQ
jgi:hypothetical protein